MTMRSADMALGVPFNIASYATLTHIVAQIVGMVPGTLVINMTDCHMYSNHVTGVMEQIQRRPFRFPMFRFGPAITEKKDLSIDDFCNESAEFLEQFIVQDYVSHPAIKFKMAV
jgi:thymidylate synthase